MGSPKVRNFSRSSVVVTVWPPTQPPSALVHYRCSNPPLITSYLLIPLFCQISHFAVAIVIIIPPSLYHQCSSLLDEVLHLMIFIRS